MALSDISSTGQIATIASYAYDTKVSQTVQNPGNITHLQQELDTIYSWAEVKSLQFNVGIFQALCYKHVKRKGMQTRYTDRGGVAILESVSVLDLGIIMSNI